MEEVKKSFKPITFFELRRLIDEKIVDGLFIAEHAHSDYVRSIMKVIKLYGLPKVSVLNLLNPFDNIYRLDKNKAFLPYLEAHVVDSCNLNCKGCIHYAPLFGENDFYPPKNFERDIRRISECVDVVSFCLMGGEPFKAKNLDEYIKIVKNYMPQTQIKILTNGLLIPDAPQKFFDAMRENKCIVGITVYKPTLKIFDKIEKRLGENKIPFIRDSKGNEAVESFRKEWTFKSLDLPFISPTPACGCRDSRFLRDGFIYKCPVDAVSYKVVERFGIKNFPKPVCVDVHAQNFVSVLEFLDSFGSVERCNYCKVPGRLEEWSASNKPTLKDILYDPEETKLLKNF